MIWDWTMKGLRALQRNVRRARPGRCQLETLECREMLSACVVSKLPILTGGHRGPVLVVPGPPIALVPPRISPPAGPPGEPIQTILIPDPPVYHGPVVFREAGETFKQVVS